MWLHMLSPFFFMPIYVPATLWKNSRLFLEALRIDEIHISVKTSSTQGPMSQQWHPAFDHNPVGINDVEMILTKCSASQIGRIRHSKRCHVHALSTELWDNLLVHGLNNRAAVLTGKTWQSLLCDQIYYMRRMAWTLSITRRALNESLCFSKCDFT